MLKGEVRHSDSTGVQGTVRTGDVQWTATGNGISHEEVPRPLGTGQGYTEILRFQLWASLPGEECVEVILVVGRAHEPGTVEEPTSDLHVPLTYMDVG